MVKVKEDLTGQQFGRLTVIKQIEDHIEPSGRSYAQWLCECSCVEHKRIHVLGKNLLKKNGTRSCGCIQKEKLAERNSKGGNKLELDKFDYGIGYTSDGSEFWFDKEDIDIVEKYYWYYNSQGYVRGYNKQTGEGAALHRLVMGITDPMVEIDHKNHPPRNEHKKDNRKSNLQIVTSIQNGMNRSLNINNTSGYTGVCWSKKEKRWQVSIQCNKKRIYLGSYDTKEEAIQVRKEAEIKYFGEYRYGANN